MPRSVIDDLEFIGQEDVKQSILKIWSELCEQNRSRMPYK